MNARQQAAQHARALAQRNSTAVLSTLSKKLQGMPFGSVSPVMLTEQGDAIFYVSDIAQHARNLNEDNRLSITLFDSAEQGDQNTQERLTLSGRAQITEDDGIAERYRQRFPAAKGYKSAHDFRFWKMTIEQVRFIAGFGEIFWLSADEWRMPKPEWDDQAALAMIEHMNKDHADACVLILQQHLKLERLEPGDVTMISVYPEGFHLMHNKRTYFVPFSDTAKTATEVRQLLVAMTHQARAA